jgi:uncharacterized protein YbaP (TraB family)
VDHTDGCVTFATRFRAALALIVALAAPCAASEPFAHGLLWRLDKAGVPTSWVFGTLHSNDPRVTAVPAPVAHAFSQARTFAMEIYWPETEDEQFYEAMQFDDGRRLASLVGDELYSRLRQEVGSAAFPEETLARTKPWAALLRIAVARGKGDGATLDRLSWRGSTATWRRSQASIARRRAMIPTSGGITRC